MANKIHHPFNSIFSWYIKKRIHQIDLFRKYPSEVQQETLLKLLSKAKNTAVGRKYDFNSISSISEFKNRVPIQEYKDIEPTINQLKRGVQNLTWPTEIKWFAKSSGTTTGNSKFIPVSRESLADCHYKGGKDLLALYYNNFPKTKLFKGKHLILGGSSQLNYFNKDSYFGDLSAIIVENLPWWCEWRRTPKKQITLQENWEKKIDEMAQSTIDQDVYILAGVPSWTLVLLKKILEKSKGKSIAEIWPNLELYMHGGVNFNPYKKQFEELIKLPKMNYVETYNASEGFFGIQDLTTSNSMLLMLDYGIFFEFIPLANIKEHQPKTLSIEDVELNKPYALVISSNAGLWRYLIGDTIKFTSKYPFRFKFSGRTKSFINAFGEELIIEDADSAIVSACEKSNAEIIDYTAGPIYMTDQSKGTHEWLIEFSNSPENIADFTVFLDESLKQSNSDYAAKRKENINMGMPVIRAMPKGTFYNWLKNNGKLGGQHKIPRLTNNRKIIESILRTS
jgi:hypothetical protein